MTDWQLLSRYTQGDSAALESLIRRHADFVFASATRLTNAADAPDITQAVFILLTRKASAIPHRGTLIGWLYQTTRLCAANLRKIQSRRRRHEREAAMSRPEASAQLPPLEPLASAFDDLAAQLESALAALSTPDRDVLLLHFLGNKTYAQTAVELRTTEEAARKRATRALEKLRAILVPRAQLPLAALPPFLASHAAFLAPPALLSTLVAGAPMTSAAASLVAAVSHSLQLARLKFASLALTGLLLLTAAVFLFQSHFRSASVSVPLAAAPAQSAATPVSATLPATPPSPTIAGPVQMVKWSIFLRAPAADRIKHLCTPVAAPQTRWYTTMQGDGEALFKAVNDATAAGQTVADRSGNPLHFASHSDTGQRVSYALDDIVSHNPRYDLSRNPERATFLFESFGHVTMIPSPLGITLQVNFPAITLRAASRTTPRTPPVTLAPTMIYTGDLAPGQALVFLGQFSEAQHPELYELVVWQTFRAPLSAMPLFESIHSTDEWLARGGPAALLRAFRQSQYWNHAATAVVGDVAPQFTRTLKDGRIVKLVAVGRPKQFPACWWNPAGQPLPGTDHWSNLARGQSSDLAAVLLLTDPSKPPLPLGNLSMTDYVYTDSQGTSVTYGIDDATQPTLTVGIGGGPWEDAGLIHDGQKLTLRDIPVTVSIVGDTTIALSKAIPDVELRVEITTRDGKILHEPVPPRLIELDGIATPYQCDFFSPASTIVSTHLYIRDREQLTFQAFSASPVTIPTLPPASGPSPADAQAEIDKQMFDLIDVAAAGDPAKLRPYFAATTDAEKQAAGRAATLLIATEQLTRAAQAKFGKTAAQSALFSGGITPLEFMLALDWEVGPANAHIVEHFPMTLVRQGNRWLIPTNPWFSSRSAALMPDFQSLRRDLDAGKYPTPESLTIAARAQIDQAINALRRRN